MKVNKLVWSTHFDSIDHPLTIGSLIIELLAKADVRIIDLKFEIKPHNTAFGDINAQGYNSYGTIYILSEDYSKLMIMFETNKKMLNPNFPEVIDVMLHQRPFTDIEKQDWNYTTEGNQLMMIDKSDDDIPLSIYKKMGIVGFEHPDPNYPGWFELYEVRINKNGEYVTVGSNIIVKPEYR